jgi:hypothetical protein
MFTARYALSPYIKQIRFVFKGLMGLYPRDRAVGMWSWFHVSTRDVDEICAVLGYYAALSHPIGSVFKGKKSKKWEWS